ncbi:complement C1q-like protein 4 [Mizuhopecten yessoensis]|uniref:Complement C1q-like protein 4 n=1 Tax=Mizuhopecten yessoensis TaxID=6573 RepID=A0A210PTC8_MIZYE|nr:complement C1q-like protein 4 [Mizuhopecten yessoensis]OWF39760.1 Complement C1q-like protein 4 [Mizuhopecten yessoensis]
MSFLFLSVILFSLSLAFGNPGKDVSEWEKLRADDMKLFHSLKQELNTIRVENQQLSSDNQKLSERLSALESTDSLHRLGRQTGSNVAFYAIIRQNIPHVSDHQTLHYEYTYTNDGNAYTPSTGVFTCPTSGTYVFHWSINQAVPTSGLGGTITTSLLNNGRFVGMLQTGDNNVPASSSNSAILNLRVGDRIYVQVTQASSDAYIGQTYSGFSGFKLF